MYIKTLFLNGKIFTSDKENQYAESMTVSLGSINFVGTTLDTLKSVGLTSIYDPEIVEFEVVDLKGKTVIPGLIDANTGKADSGTEISITQDQLADGLVAISENLSSKGFTSVTGTGLLNGHDAFEIYQDAIQNGFDQYVSLYYPWSYIKTNSNILEDKHKLIRSRKVHVAGVLLPNSNNLTDAEIDEAIDFCRSNFCQLSIYAQNENLRERVLAKLEGTDNWMEGTGVPALRLDYETENPDPFSIVQSAFENGVGREEAISLYTLDAAITSGFSGQGQIAKGARANFVILSDDVFSVSQDEIKNIRPEATFIDGICTYSAPWSEFQLTAKHIGSITDEEPTIKLAE